MACILENVPYVNDSPRTPLFPTALSFAECHKAFLGGDDLKKGQTMVKSVLAELVVNPPVVDDRTAASHLLYKRALPGTTKKMVDCKVVADKGEHPSSTSVPSATQRIPWTQDNYTSERRLGGRKRLLLTNLCEDSLLASPFLLDPAILGELMTRIQCSMHSVLSLLSYSLEALLCKPKTDVVNSLSRQRTAVTNMLRLADSGVVNT
ncbi:hypothetical protein V8E36_001662 [Tilletia maclaganii]